MSLAHALQTIRQPWRVLPHESTASHEAIWIRIPPEDAAEVYEEWVGTRRGGAPGRSLLAQAFRHSRVMGGQAVQADVLVMPAGDDALVTGVAVADLTMDLR
jgi:hypothetical protein